MHHRLPHVQRTWATRPNHLWNVRSGLADKPGMSKMVMHRFLGHTLKQSRAHYLKSVDPACLADLVNLISAEYLGGESVGS